MFEERRDKRIKESEGADLRYKKASFEASQTFVYFLLLHFCAIIKDRFFNTQLRSLYSSLSLSRSPPHLLLPSPRMLHCVSAEKLYIFCSHFEVLMTM